MVTLLMSKPFIGGFFMNKILESKKIKTILYVVCVLWIAVITQIVVNRFYQDDARIMDVFIGTGTNIEESKLNLVVDYGNEYMISSEKERIVNELATEVGLTDWEMNIESTDRTSTLKVEDTSKEQDTSIEFITVTRKEDEKNMIYNHFILMELVVKENFKENFESLLQYKKDIESYINKIGNNDYQCTIKFAGSYNGKLTSQQRDAKVNDILKGLEAKKVDFIDSDSYYTTYAYTGLVKDYIEVTGNRININIVISYNEQEDKTELYLATPILNEEY